MKYLPLLLLAGCGLPLTGSGELEEDASPDIAPALQVDGPHFPHPRPEAGPTTVEDAGDAGGHPDAAEASTVVCTVANSWVQTCTGETCGCTDAGEPCGCPANLESLYECPQQGGCPAACLPNAACRAGYGGTVCCPQ